MSRHDRQEKVALVLKLDASQVHARNKWNNTPLHSAAFYGNDDVIQVLVRHGANVHSVGELGGGPIRAAAQLGHTQCIHELIKCGADVYMQDDNLDNSLHVATIFNSAACVKILVQNYGVSPNIKTKSGHTALHIAAEEGNLETIKLLTSHPCCFVDLEDPSGHTAADIAAQYKHFAVADYLHTPQKVRDDAAPRVTAVPDFTEAETDRVTKPCSEYIFLHCTCTYSVPVTVNTCKCMENVWSGEYTPCTCGRQRFSYQLVSFSLLPAA